MTAAAVSAAPPGTDEITRLPLTKLVESPWNPRKHFDPAKLAETADSLRTSGQLTPIVVRPFRGRPGCYEIGAGHRRFRAAPQAGLTSLLAVVRDLDDVAFLELLTIENKQREDVTPLDEAAGFRLLMEKAGYDIGKLAARIGLSTKYVYDRLKLLQLIPAAKQLLEQGTITAGHAILLARLSKEDQGRVVDVDEGGLFQDERIHDELELKGLFPETVAQLTDATRHNLKVVHITGDWIANEDVRHDGTKDRVYGSQSWKRADGKQKSKACAFSALGVVVSGFGQGEAFTVCVNRDRCAVHWPKQAKRKQAKAAGRDPYAEQQERDRRKHEEEKKEQARWKSATPALLKALAAKIQAGAVRPGSPIWRELLDCVERARGPGTLQPGATAESLARFLAYGRIASELTGYLWHPWEEVPRALKPFGIDAAAIVDQVAPKPKAEAPAKRAKPVKKATRA